MNAYEQRQEAKRERLERAAARAAGESDRRFNAARNATAGIEFGQPILVGHHSEKRHRRAIEKADNHMRKGIEAQKAAQELAYRAAAVGTGGISSDDPDAVMKLRDELDAAKAKQQQRKDTNAAIRKHKKAGPAAQVAALVAMGYSEGVAGKLLEPDCLGRIGFPDYSIKNAGANIRRIEKRIAHLERRAVEVAANPEPETTTYPTGATVTTDPEDNRVLLRFPARLPHADYKTVRSYGFVWSPTRNAFVRKLGSNATWAARSLAEQLPTKETA